MIIHISGPSGSDKTTLGNKIAKISNTIVIDTDDIDDPNSIKIMKKENKIDILKSIITKEKCNRKRRRRLNNQCLKQRTKVLNIVNDFQWKLSSFLCKNYKTIYLPIFKSKELKNNLNSKNNRLLDLLSHFKFQEKMKYQSKKYGCNLKIVGEEYTTKTCGNCGNLNNFVGMSKEYWCYKCKIILERDYQAARNILIKNLCCI